MAFEKKAKKGLSMEAKRGRGRPTKGEKWRSLGPDGRPRKSWRDSRGNFKIFIFKVLKQVHPDIGISTKSMSIMESFMMDIFEKIAAEASKLARLNKQSTILSRDIQTATKLLLPGELCKHAVSEGIKSVTKYNASKAV